MDYKLLIEKRKKYTDDIKTTIIEVLNLGLKVEDVPDDVILFGSGLDLDSIDALQLVVAIESKFCIVLPQEQPHILRSVNTIVDYIINIGDPESHSKIIADEEKLLDCDNEDYIAIRTDIGVIERSNLAILKIEGDEILDFMDQIVTGKLHSLQDNNVLQTLILNDNGSILSYVELQNHSDSYWLVLEREKLESVKSVLDNEKSACKIEVLDSVAIIDIVGPNAVSIIEGFLGADVIGMRPKMMVKTVLEEGEEIVVIRTNYYGEFGYQLILNKNIVNLFFEKIQAFAGKSLKKCDPKILDLLFLEAFSFHENNFLLNNENIFEAGLQWMIDLKKRNFIGKASILKLSENALDKKLVLFLCKTRKESISSNQQLFLDGEKIGYIVTSSFSYIMNHLIGLAYVNVKHAWPGVCLALPDDKTQNGFFEIVSAPFFISKSFSSIG